MAQYTVMIFVSVLMSAALIQMISVGTTAAMTTEANNGTTTPENSAVTCAVNVFLMSAAAILAIAGRN